MDYNLNFHDAIDVILAGRWVRGDNFAKGVFIKINEYGQIVVVDATQMYREIEFVSITSLNNQKFREIGVATVKELSK